MYSKNWVDSATVSELLVAYLHHHLMYVPVGKIKLAITKYHMLVVGT